ncbi:hypothetical protein V7146_16270 [Gottfriedia acidiceleris]|uniref:hypothetical protein n=1 Tax=Gottfriedia acidiceleris TaxID=371036 RepID=UPI002FFE60F0
MNPFLIFFGIVIIIAVIRSIFSYMSNAYKHGKDVREKIELEDKLEKEKLELDEKLKDESWRCPRCDVRVPIERKGCQCGQHRVVRGN